MKLKLSLWGLLLITHSLLAADCPTGLTNSCTEPPAFPVGRWEFSEDTGTVGISGQSEFSYIKNGATVTYSATWSGSFTYSRVGGPENNYIEIDCQGVITGKGMDRFIGSSNGDANSAPCPNNFSYSHASLTINREYNIKGMVRPDGSLVLTNRMTGGSYNASMNNTFKTPAPPFDEGDCFVTDDPASCGEGILDNQEFVDLEVLQLTGTFNSESNKWDAVLTPVKTLAIEGGTVYEGTYTSWLAGWLRNNGCAGETLDDGSRYWDYMLDDQLSEGDFDPSGTNTITTTMTSKLVLRTPTVKEAYLQEPQFFLKNIPYNTTLVLTPDWKESEGTREVEFVYGGETTTLSGNTVMFPFDTDKADDKILITPKANEVGSQFTFHVPKVDLPPWAGMISDWYASPGVKYQGWVDWPITLQTTRSISGNPLFSGQWGLTAKVSSRLDMKANSDGTPGSADFLASATASFAGRSKTLELKGKSTTTLACDKLTVTGFGTAELPLVDWEKSMNPISLVLGAKDAACALGRLPCSLTGKAGLSASIKINLTGTPTFGDDGSAIKWTGGSLGGNLKATVSLSVVPPPLNKVANVTVEGGGSGCVQFQVAPDLQLETLGGKVFASVTASAMFLGSTTAYKEWTFGDPCGGGGGAAAAAPAMLSLKAGGITPMALSLDPGNAVDRDIHLTMALAPDARAVAAWSEIPVGQQRPSGDIAIKLYDGTNWGAGILVTSDAQADNGPALAYDGNGNILLCYQRNPNLPLPADISQFATFAAGFELHYALLNPTNGSVIATAVLTGNGDFDFGPTLRTDTNGLVHLFWQRTDGRSIEGVPGHEASILHRVWNGTTWSAEETIVAGLVDSLGWHPAALDANNYFVALVLDHDGDLETETDMEIHQVQKTAGVLQPLTQVTTNSLPDNAPVAGFDSAGQPVLVWREDHQLKGLIGSLQNSVTTVVASPLEVGPTFANGVLRNFGDELWLVWPGANDIHFTLLRDGVWNKPTAVAFTDDADECFDARVEDETNLRLATASTAFAPNFETLATNSVLNVFASSLGNRRGEIASVTATGGTVSLGLLGEGQTQYTLQGRNSLSSTNTWVDLDTITTQTDGRARVNHYPAEGEKEFYYRLKR